MEDNEQLESEIVEGGVSDADLEAAFQEFIGTEEVETTTETIPDVHSESSRLGRKVKFMENNMVSKNEFNRLHSKIDTLLEQLNRKPIEPDLDEYGNVIERPVDIDNLVEQKIVQFETKKQKEIRESDEKYQSSYLANLRELINEVEDPIAAREVFKRMTTPGSEFNKRYSDNPYSDVSKNFIKAVKSVKTPFSGERGARVPVGVSTVGIQNTPARKTPKLDPEAEEFAKLTGMTEESILSALEGEMPSKFIR